MSTHKITWLLYHEPIDLFIRTAKAFKERIAQRTNNRIQVEVYTTKEYAAKFNNGLNFDPVTLIEHGHVQMSQLQVNELAKTGATDFFALDMPFLFKDHDHCARALEGEIGKFLFSKLKEKANVKGLAFTYSGGYRVIATDKIISGLSDLKGLGVVTVTNPVHIDTFKAFGCDVTAISPRSAKESDKEIKKGKTLQTTLPRYKNEANPKFHKFVTNTEHSMYLTSIIVGQQFWDSLSAEDQAAMQITASECAKLERQWTLEDAESIASDKEAQRKLGIENYAQMSKEGKAELKQASDSIYDKYRQVLTLGLVDRILSA